MKEKLLFMSALISVVLNLCLLVNINDKNREIELCKGIIDLQKKVIKKAKNRVDHLTRIIEEEGY